MYKVFVIDDEIEICNILEEFLTKKGFKVFTAQSGEQALDVLDKEEPHLVIVDTKMRGMGGEGLLQELKRRKPDMPAIILTGFSDRQDLKSIEEMGYKNFLFKPIDLNIIFEMINKNLKRIPNGEEKNSHC